MQDLADDYNISLRWLQELVPVKITSSFPKAKRQHVEASYPK